jgi:hypothetical protein
MNSPQILGWSQTLQGVARSMESDMDEYGSPDVYYTSPEDGEAITIQFGGWAVVLLPDGKYYLSDTSGG